MNAAGGWSHHIQHMALKATTYMHAIVAWARSNEVSLCITLKVWALYVLRAILYGTSVCKLSQTVKLAIDYAHRRCGRLALGFGRRTPSQAMLAAHGRTRMSSCLLYERVGLAKRVWHSDNPVVNAIAGPAAVLPNSWFLKH